MATTQGSQGRQWWPPALLYATGGGVLPFKAAAAMLDAVERTGPKGADPRREHASEREAPAAY
jgi:hypothetical protein